MCGLHYSISLQNLPALSGLVNILGPSTYNQTLFVYKQARASRNLLILGNLFLALLPSCDFTDH